MLLFFTPLQLTSICIYRIEMIAVSTLLKNQGSFVQSIVSLTSTLRVISLSVLVDSIYNIVIFFAEKM